MVISPLHRTLIASTHNQLEFRVTLLVEERSRLEARMLQWHEALLAEAQEAVEVAALPLLSSDPIRKREWIKKKTHGKADARGLTSVEIAGRRLRAQENKERAAYKALNTPCPTGLQYSWPDRPSILFARQAFNTLCPTGPIGTAHRPNGLPGMPCPSPDVPGLPASTAPARLQQEPTTGQRKREDHPGLQRGKAGRITFPRLFPVMSIPCWALYI
jgi:hypothetical protein